MDQAAFWDKVAAKYAKDPISDIEGYRLTRDRIAEILQPHHQVLELGCGTGTTALELANGVQHYLATDVSAKMIEIAESKRSAVAADTLSFAVQDAAQLPDGGHDVILALNLLHLMPNLEDLLRQIYDSLPVGGMLISKTSLLGDGLWVLPWIIPVMRMFGKAPYVNVLTQKDVVNRLEAAGFVISEKLSQGGTVPRVFIVATKA